MGQCRRRTRTRWADISKARGADVPVDRPVVAGPTVALTLGSNVERWLKYQDDGAKFAASMGTSKRLLIEGNPQNVVNGGVAILRRRYPQIKTVDDLATAQLQHFATTFVFDIQSKWGMMPGSETTCDISIIALDAQQNPISRLVGHGVSVIRPYVEPNALEAPNNALLDLNAKANRLLN